MSKKPSLETQVREALIEQKTGELIKQVSENKPTYAKIVETVTLSISDSIVDSIVTALGGSVNKEEIEEMKQEYKSGLLSQIKARFENPEQLKQMMCEYAKNEYASVKQTKTILKLMLAKMKEVEIEENILTKFEKSLDELFEYQKMKNNIVERLVKIAKIKGIKKAIQKETRYAVIKEMFPTPEEYRSFLQKGIETAKKFCNKSQSILMTDGVGGKYIGGLMGGFGKLMEKLQELPWMIQKDDMGREIQEIYK